MATPPAWKVWYADGTTYTAADGGPAGAPARGVQAVTYPSDRVGVRVLTGHDYYWWDDEQAAWLGGDSFGLWDYLARPGWKRVLFGRTLPDDEYRALMAQVRADPDLPDKSAHHPDERPAGES